MKVLITGDIHNNFRELNRLINKEHPELVICAGDFGVWPKFAEIKQAKALSEIKLYTCKELRFCDGNHEDHWFLRDRKSDELEPGIIYMPRGSTYTLPDGRTIMFFGGAESIDKNMRTLGIDWFPEELITQKDFQNLPESKVDIFITHTCSKEIFKEIRDLNMYKMKDPCYEALSQLWEMYKPERWYFGHFHYHRWGKLQDTRWECLGAVNHGTKWWTWLD